MLLQKSVVQASVASTRRPATTVTLPRRAVAPTRSKRNVCPRATKTGVDEKNLRAAEARWESSVREGKIKNVSCKDAGELMQSGWVMLDVRPPTETQRVPIKGAVEVPLFIPDPEVSITGLLKQATAFGMGGWWLGGGHNIPNPNFLAEVQAKVPKDAKVIVGCQKGLRSLAACEQLSLAGYTQLAWVNGGFDTCKKGELPSEIDIRYAGIGGFSEFLGWTEVQQDENKQKFGGIFGIVKIAAVLVFLDGLLFAYEQWQYYQSQQ